VLNEFIAKAKVEKFVTPLQMLSTDPALARTIKETAEIIFIDADHSYSNAYKDIEIAYGLLSENGLLVLDDVGSKHSPSIDPEHKGGVRQALLDFLKTKPGLPAFMLEPPLWLNPCGIGLVCKQNLR